MNNDKLKQVALTPLSLLPVAIAKTGSTGAFEMNKDRIQKALLKKEISLKTYIKWAILYDHGKTTHAIIDINTIIEGWSFSGKRKEKYVDFFLTIGDILEAISASDKEEEFIIISPNFQIELNLYPEL